jgi:hypothetical protein
MAGLITGYVLNMGKASMLKHPKPNLRSTLSLQQQIGALLEETTKMPNIKKSLHMIVRSLHAKG